MASPQVENGYTRIADELLEALARTRIPGEARQVFDAILRKTYGFNKTEDAISLSQLCLATGLKKPHVCRALNTLRSMNLVAVKGNCLANIRRINKNFDRWKPLPKKITVTEKDNERYRKRESALPFSGHTKETSTKETFTKENFFVENSVEFRLAEMLSKQILKNNPKAKKPNLQSWAKHIDLMIRRDSRTPEEIETIIRWCQADSFWSTNILSTTKLREKFDQLTMKMKKEGEGNAGNWKPNAKPTGRTFEAELKREREQEQEHD